MRLLKHGRSLAVLTATAVAFTALFAVSAPAMAQSASAPAAQAQGHVVGMAFVGRSVSDLDKAIAFYKALGFTQDMQANPAWRKDPITEQIYGIKGAKGVETRMAKMAINSNQSGQVFNVYLREFRGLPRKTLTGYDAWEPGATHFGLVVPDANTLWAELKAHGLLKARSWGGELIAPPGQTKGMLAYLTDPDGLDIEIIDQRPATPAANGAPARPAMTPGISHVGLIILDADKARGFYETFMGAKLAGSPTPPWLHGDFYDSAIGAHGNILRFFNEGFPEARAADKRLNLELVEFQNRKKPVQSYHAYDIATQYVGFEVDNLDAFLARAKAAGAKPVTTGGVATMKSGTRVAIIRDPDVGGFVEVYEHAKK
jgi:catechol 2,3-dioxygenase-like lactoylglutathione lyase family enzyme